MHLCDMQYKLSYKNPNNHYLDIEFTADSLDGTEVEVQLPAWRPGRYELGNFAKNVQQWQAFGANGKLLRSEKLYKDSWLVQLDGSESLTVRYNYYANEMNAGSTFLDANQLYVNPVNCFLYLPNRQNEPCTVHLNIPSQYIVACSMEQEGATLKAGSYHELVDSPFICSAGLVSQNYEAGSVEFTVWFNGLSAPDWDKLLPHFKAFAEAQMNYFETIPCKHYHFLFQILPYEHYHGVEHWASTVITLGPDADVMTKKYSSLLGVSSHELYHTWNIKSIRPIEMMPYDYSGENYSKLGYVAEGVTTYMGDVFLLKSEVFSFEDYNQEFSKVLDRHFHNFGRQHRPVAESSFDTWLDGYVIGAPHRKTSIYVEGCLCAFIADTMLMKATGNKASLHTVMKLMYERFGKTQTGYSENDYKCLLEEVSGENFDEYFNKLIGGTKDYTPWIEEACNYIGCQLTSTENTDEFIRLAGAKYVKVGALNKITVVAPGSPAEKAGIDASDELIEYTITGNRIVAVVKRNGLVLNKNIELGENRYFNEYSLSRLPDCTPEQEAAYTIWSSNEPQID